MPMLDELGGNAGCTSDGGIGSVAMGAQISKTLSNLVLQEIPVPSKDIFRVIIAVDQNHATGSNCTSTCYIHWDW